MADADALVAACMAAQKRYSRTGNIALSSQKTQQMVIGLAIDRRRRNTNLQAAIGLGGNDLITAGARLQTNIQDQVVILPAPGRCIHRRSVRHAPADGGQHPASQ